MKKSSRRLGLLWGRRSAFIGALAWLLLLTFQLADASETDLIERILLLAILVIVPLGFSLVPVSLGAKQTNFRIAQLLHPLGAAAAIGSVFLNPGIPAALLASVWLLITTTIAIFGISRLLRQEYRSAEELSINAGLLYLPVGAAWYVMRRLGIQPLGFGDTIVLLTAVHFHFAGFAAPLLAGLAGRRLRSSRSVTPTFRFAVINIIAGTPLVAAGITFSPFLGLIGTLVISVGLVILALMVSLSIVPSLRSTLAQVLLLISSLSILPAMLLACLYAYSLVAQTLIIDIPQMAVTHGILNAFGFSLCGLLAWTILHNPEPATFD